MIPNENNPCLKCRLCESNGMYLFCEAFNKGIPDEIIEGLNDHSGPLTNQENDIVFEPINENDNKDLPN